MKLISWNVNGIRAVAKKGFSDFLLQEKPDILGLQEVKISEQARLDQEFHFPGYNIHWHSALRPGYSGTAVLVRNNLVGFCGVKNGLGEEKFDTEGRVQTVELDNFFLLNIYFPNANSELSRLGYKLEFNEALLKHIKRLEKKKGVIVTGDFNVAHQPIDLARPKANEGQAGYTKEERSWMNKFLASGYIDTFRHLHGERVQYSWWSYRMDARSRNVGWRIDYFCVLAKLGRLVKKAYILDQVTGSDHAPIGLEL